MQKRLLFGADYEKKAHLQKGFNPQIINDLIRYILDAKPEATTTPIRILDLCCGDGGSTYLLLDQLDHHGIQVDALVGYDNSPAQINVANANYQDSRLHFEVKDITLMMENQSFDVVLSLFGLHWIADIKAVSAKIHQSLKPNGLLMFFVPLEKPDFFTLRKQQLASEKWHQQFNNFTLRPFITCPNDYLAAFSPFFNLVNEQGIVGEQTVEFERARFADFLSSWMEEVRHLANQEEKLALVEDVINSISILTEPCCAAKYTDSGKICFFEKFLWFHGEKKQAFIDSAVAPVATMFCD